MAIYIMGGKFCKGLDDTCDSPKRGDLDLKKFFDGKLDEEELAQVDEIVRQYMEEAEFEKKQAAAAAEELRAENERIQHQWKLISDRFDALNLHGRDGSSSKTKKRRNKHKKKKKKTRVKKISTKKKKGGRRTRRR